MRFAAAPRFKSEWKDFAAYHFLVPRFEMIRQGDHCTFIYNFSNVPDFEVNSARFKPEADFRKLDAQKPLRKKPEFNLEQKEDFPHRSQWMRGVSEALDYLQQGKIQKIVLARKSNFHFRKPIDSLILFKKLKMNARGSFSFYLQLSDSLAFLGISPERLYTRENASIVSEAIAGTRPRGKNRTEDVMLENELMRSDKEQREQKWVSREIEQKLGKLCTSVHGIQDRQVLKLKYVQHLQSIFQGSLRPEHTDGDILAGLHPTSAVAGVPGKQALSYLQKIEKFDRGWYAGPIGWFGPHHAEFGVALRCALVKDHTLTAYAGAGIVEGSDPENEWQETENKLLNFTKLFL